jgi:hypothetical protein
MQYCCSLLLLLKYHIVGCTRGREIQRSISTAAVVSLLLAGIAYIREELGKLH